MAGDARPLSAARRDAVPAVGVVKVRLQGRPEDVDRVAVAIQEALTALHDPRYAYQDRNGVTVRRYLTVDLREGPC